MKGEARRRTVPQSPPRETLQPPAPRDATAEPERPPRARQPRDAHRHGRLRTQPANTGAEKKASRNGVRAEQRILPENAGRTAISRRYEGTPKAPGTRRDEHLRSIEQRITPPNEAAERTASGILPNEPAPKTSPHRYAPSVPRCRHAPSVPRPYADHRNACRPAPSVPAPETRPEKDRPGREQNARVWRLRARGTERCTSLYRSR